MTPREKKALEEVARSAGRVMRHFAEWPEREPVSRYRADVAMTELFLALEDLKEVRAQQRKAKRAVSKKGGRRG